MLAFLPYYEAITAGSVWLPEDLLYVTVLAHDTANGHRVGLFGTRVGGKLRTFLREVRRPLIWSVEGASGMMIIDPLVANNSLRSGSSTFSHPTSLQADLPVWEAAWETARATRSVSVVQQREQFATLASTVPPHLQLQHLDYLRRRVCEEVEMDGAKQVIGIDGNGECVYWMFEGDDAAMRRWPDIPEDPGDSGGWRWEMLNDGSCEPSGRTSQTTLSSPRHLFESADACHTAAGVMRWQCIRPSPELLDPEVTQCLAGMQWTLPCLAMAISMPSRVTLSWLNIPCLTLEHLADTVLLPRRPTSKVLLTIGASLTVRG